MSNVINTVLLRLCYESKDGSQVYKTVALLDDLNEGFLAVNEELSALQIGEFNAARFGIPSPAHYKYDWQEDENHHSKVKVCGILSFPVLTSIYEMAKSGGDKNELKSLSMGTMPDVDFWADTPLSKLLDAVRNGGIEDFDVESESALKAEHKRLSELLGANNQNVVINIAENGRVESVLTESDDLTLNCVVMDKGCDDITEDIACNIFGVRTWLYRLPSRGRSDQVCHAHTVNELSLRYLANTRFKAEDGRLLVSEANGDYLERVRYPVGMTDQAVESMVNVLNNFDW
ncbi:hypothetical protein [Vibrio owensii]|uniref:hypothetical protein n=1 Tax=Vibrio owensii TaxID=696485 RepID=UPI0018F114A8|nr:hypothetical protein [Vibrio owensii]